MDIFCKILRNDVVRGPYRRIVFDAPEIAASAQPGQFVHVKIPPLRDRILRRPFSICDADRATGELTLVYKIVGEGTNVLAAMRPGESCFVLGPQGNGYTLPAPEEKIYPILAAGGYGSASTFLLARRLQGKGTLLTGARTAADLLLTDEYRALGFDVLTATDDGSAGRRGLVTDLLSAALDKAAGHGKIFACGPSPMLMALGRLSLTLGVPCELSLDQHMCCGVGACFACVVKIKDESSPDHWRYSRSCKEGPVYGAEEVYYG